MIDNISEGERTKSAALITKLKGAVANSMALKNGAICNAHRDSLVRISAS